MDPSTAFSDSTDLFEGRETEHEIISGRTVCFRPLSENTEGPFVFQLDSQGPDQYLKLDSIRLNGKCSISKIDDTPITNMDDLSIVNMFPASLFRSIEVDFNHTLVTDLTSSMANYQAYMQTTMSYNLGAQKTHLQGQLYVPDDAERFDTLTRFADKAKMIQYFETEGSRFYTPDYIMQRLKSGGLFTTPEEEVTDPTQANLTQDEKKQMADDAKKKKEAVKTVQDVLQEFGRELKGKERINSGFVERGKIIEKSNKFDFYIPLASDILQSDKQLHPIINLRIKLTRAFDTFSLLCSDNTRYKINLQDLRIFARYVTVSPKLVAEHNRLLAKGDPLVYPITRTMMKSYSLAPGSMSTYAANMFHGVLPKSIIVGFVRTEAFHGSQNYNPFNFEHFDMDSCVLRVNGENVPSEPISPDFKTECFMREYMEFYRNIGIDLSEDAGNIITPALYKGGMFFMSFDLNGDQCNMLHRHEKQTGVIDLNVVFQKSLSQATTIVVCGFFDAQIEKTLKDPPLIKYF